MNTGFFHSLRREEGQYHSVNRPHAHQNYQILHIYRGQVSLLIDEVLCHAKAPAVILFNCFEKHKIISSSVDYSRYILELRNDTPKLCSDFRLSAMLKDRPEGVKYILTPDAENAEFILHIMKTLMKEIDQPMLLSQVFSDSLIKQLLVILCRMIGDGWPTPSELALSVKKYIDLHFTEIFSLQSMIHQFNISGSLLSHSFKKHTGYAPMSYVIFSKLNYASELLTTTDQSVQSICLKCGFKDINNFIRLFKKHYNLTPLQYRKSKSMR